MVLLSHIGLSKFKLQLKLLFYNLIKMNPYNINKQFKTA